MSLRRCPGCHNMVLAESTACPICGCNPTARLIGRVVRWTVILVIFGWLVLRYLWPMMSAHSGK